MRQEADCIFRGFTGSFSHEVAPPAAAVHRLKLELLSVRARQKKHEKPERSSSRANETRLPLVSLKIQERDDVKFAPEAIRKVNDLDTSEAG